MGKRAILCVDDEVIILLSMIQELKRSFGSRFVYEQAIDAESALETINDLEADGVTVILVISDWLMPGIKGDEFIDLVHQRYPAIKAVMVTGHADREVIDRVLEGGSVVAVLEKPWRTSELAAVIERCCIDD
ncbi:MAG TPA: response regulator [Treponemataceae bacterium]|jgi:CheY-like chemotaxis protein|nr:response regulator [Treponemataceae bacterium]